ncbi:hypothetical protein HDV04_001689 [Boothiomyces sp. JEL0838]|nr:hypothetical protein HDV04_001689 [Boothiomyces sp. JEL0838]
MREEDDEFFYKQAKLRAEIRLKENRPQPIDLIVINLTIKNIDILEILDNLKGPELAQLLSDLQLFIQFDKQDEYYKSIKEIVEFRSQNTRTGISDKIKKDITELYATKSIAELIELEHQVKEKMKQDFIDLDYWENILKILNVYKARAKLQKYIKTVILEKKEFKRQEFKPYMEPTVSSIVQEEDLIFTQSQNQQYIQESRNEILQKYQIQQTTESLFQETIEQRQALYQQMVRDASVDMEDEEIMKSNFDFGEKYKPRKPDYYNRIKYGIEWNKYNTAHYNQDNPPPKSILGYRFNIFYPDLIDKIPPTYKVLEKPDCFVVVFTAGPPYEDIAFKIIKREWEHNHKKGFKSCFDGRM